MNAISATRARENIYQLIADVNMNGEPITITNNKGKNAVLISEEDWKAIEETLYLMAIPGMTESVLNTRKEPLDEGTIYDPEEEW